MSDTGQARYAYPAYRVYIYGVDVTQDVSSVTFGMNDGAAPSQCSISLLNDRDEYVVTTKDMLSLSNMSADKLSIPWLNKPASMTDSTLPSIQLSSDMSAADLDRYKNVINSIGQVRKSQILNRKVSVVQNVGADLRTDWAGRPVNNGGYTNYFGSTVKRYPISDGASIFHVMDPVRVFQRDPFDPSKWYWAFSGFVSDTVDAADENNTKTVTVVAEDPTKLFRYTRVFVNPGITDASKVVTDSDLKIVSLYSQAMSGMSLPEIFYTVMFGPDVSGASERIPQFANSANGQSDIHTRLRGIGHFSFDTSLICTFGPKPTEPYQSGDAPKTDLTSSRKPPLDLGLGLDKWQMLLDHQVCPSDLWTMATEYDRQHNWQAVKDRQSGMRRDGDGNILIEDVMDYIGSHPEQYLVDGGRLMMLIPNSLGADNSAVLTKDVIQAYPLQSDWISAGKILVEVIERIQFTMYCTPRGDIVVEPPLYDFDPDDFGLDAIKAKDVQMFGMNNYHPLSYGISYFGGIDRGPFGPKYVILKRDTYSWESAQVDEKVYTIAVAKKAIAQNWDSIGYSDIYGDVVVARLPDLVPLYGARQAPLTPRGYITTTDGANLYANITLNRLNADAHTMSVSHVPNVQLWLNRPIYVEGRNCLGTTKSIVHTIVWGQSGDMETNSELYALRTWNGEVIKNTDGTFRPVYSTIGGSTSRPIDYARLFKTREPTHDMTDYGYDFLARGGK